MALGYRHWGGARGSYKGNSLAKVKPKHGNAYDIEINSKFIKGTSAIKDKRFAVKVGQNKCTVRLDKGLLHPFFQKKHLLEIASNIKDEAYSEELTFEHALITDNVNREDFIFIDRQIRDKKMKMRIDLLGLQNVEKNMYTFLLQKSSLATTKNLRTTWPINCKHT